MIYSHLLTHHEFYHLRWSLSIKYRWNLMKERRRTFSFEHITSSIKSLISSLKTYKIRRKAIKTSTRWQRSHSQSSRITWRRTLNDLFQRRLTSSTTMKLIDFRYEMINTYTTRCLARDIEFCHLRTLACVNLDQKKRSKSKNDSFLNKIHYVFSCESISNRNIDCLNDFKTQSNSLFILVV